MPIDFEIQQGLRFVFTNLPNLIYYNMVLDLLLATFLYLLDFFFFTNFEKGSAPQK